VNRTLAIDVAGRACCTALEAEQRLVVGPREDSSKADTACSNVDFRSLTACLLDGSNSVDAAGADTLRLLCTTLHESSRTPQQTAPLQETRWASANGFVLEPRGRMDFPQSDDDCRHLRVRRRSTCRLRNIGSRASCAPPLPHKCTRMRHGTTGGGRRLRPRPSPVRTALRARATRRPEKVRGRMASTRSSVRGRCGSSSWSTTNNGGHALVARHSSLHRRRHRADRRCAGMTSQDPLEDAPEPNSPAPSRRASSDWTRCCAADRRNRQGDRHDRRRGSKVPACLRPMLTPESSAATAR